MNAVEIEAAISDLALAPFDAAEFRFSFLAASGNKDTPLKRLRTGNNNASDVPGGMLLRNNIHLAVCVAGSVGRTLQALRVPLRLGSMGNLCSRLLHKLPGSEIRRWYERLGAAHRKM